MNTTGELSIPALAQRLGLSIPRAQALVRSGKIPGHKTVWGWITTEDAVASFLHHDLTKVSLQRHAVHDE